MEKKNSCELHYSGQHQIYLFNKSGVWAANLEVWNKTRRSEEIPQVKLLAATIKKIKNKKCRDGAETSQYCAAFQLVKGESELV